MGTVNSRSHKYFLILLTMHSSAKKQIIQLNIHSHFQMLWYQNTVRIMIQLIIQTHVYFLHENINARLVDSLTFHITSIQKCLIQIIQINNLKMVNIQRTKTTSPLCIQIISFIKRDIYVTYYNIEDTMIQLLLYSN